MTQGCKNTRFCCDWPNTNTLFAYCFSPGLFIVVVHTGLCCWRSKQCKPAYCRQCQHTSNHLRQKPEAVHASAEPAVAHPEPRMGARSLEAFPERGRGEIPVKGSQISVTPSNCTITRPGLSDDNATGNGSLSRAPARFKIQFLF